MNPVKTVETREWSKLHVVVSMEEDWHSASAYCSRCGAPTVIAIEHAPGYDPVTGKRWLRSHSVCPNRPAFLGYGHTRQRVRIGQNELQELLYKYVLDVTLPDGQ